MKTTIVAFVLLWPWVAVSAQGTKQGPPAAPFPGATLGAVPEVLLAHLPDLTDGGLLVEDVAKDSPAYQAGLRRNDVLISVAGKKVAADGAWIKVLEKTTAGSKVDLGLVRAGKKRTLGMDWPLPEVDASQRGYLKPDGPPAVSVQAQPMPNGQFNVTILFYGDNSAKLTKLTCNGSIPEIQRQVESHATERRLPERIRDLVDVAVERLRTLNAPDSK